MKTHPYIRLVFCSALGAATIVAVGGCGSSSKPQKETPAKMTSRYEPLPPRDLPDFLTNTVLEKTVLRNTDPFIASGYGLVVNLRNTGNSVAPTAVREYIMRQMDKRGMTGPEATLRDPNVAIVQVEVNVPPGSRTGQQFDAHVSALPENYTSSLAHGELYQADLTIGGANPLSPVNSVNIPARAQGPIYVNPNYSLANAEDGSPARASVRKGVILGGAMALKDRPLVLRLRQPQYSLARIIEQRIDERFQNMDTAAALDDGLIEVKVPAVYGTDWEHFANVMQHLYLDRPAPLVRGKELADAALQPNAPLLNISYAWEALGREALPTFRDLMSHPRQDIAFAAARAGAFLGDSSAHAALLAMAQTPGEFQLNAAQTLGKLPQSPLVNQMLRKLLECPDSGVRLEAYRVLARNKDGAVYSRVIGERFVVDLVSSTGGSPIVYASQRYVPRLAFIGQQPKVAMPVLYSAFDNRLTITSSPNNDRLVIYYRGPDVAKPVMIESGPMLSELAARLGGEGPDGKEALSFSYSDVVNIILDLQKQGKIVSGTLGLTVAETPQVVLQEVPESQAIFSDVVAASDTTTIRTAEDLPELNPQAGLGRDGPGARDGSRPQ